jgi:prepilin-type N-terminal cleavage/methylation domain-containing protein
MIKDQKGFTLPELLITVAITGLIASFLGTAIYQIITVTEYGNDKAIATHELQNAAHWVSRDGQMASTASGGNRLTLTLPDGSSITYTKVANELRRTAGKSRMAIAQNISSVSFSVVGRLITMTITSSPPGRTNVNEQGTYKVCLRPGAEE